MQVMPAKRVCGVYEIKNLVTDKIYIGGSVDVYARWRLHLHELRHKKHQNGRLQNSFNKHGENVFVFKIVELCSPPVLTDREQFYLDTIRPYENGYNLAMGARRVMIGFKHSEESIKKMSESQKKKWIGKIHPLKGTKLSEERKKHLSEYFTGFRHTEEAKRKIGEASLARGVFSPEHRANMSRAQKGKPRSQKQREDISRALTGIKQSVETRAKRAASMELFFAKKRAENGGKVYVNRPRSPEAVAKTAAANRGKKRTPEQSARIGAGIRLHYQNKADQCIPKIQKSA